MSTEKTKEKTKLTSPLLNKKVKISLLTNNLSSLYKHDEDLGTLTVGGAKSFMTPKNLQGYLVDPLTSEEREYLEDLLGIDLSIHKVEKNFWTTKRAMCILRKTGSKNHTADLTLDLSNPYEFILYKIALVSPRVANSWEQREDKGRQYEFVIVDGEAKQKEELDYTLIEDEVLSYLLKHKNSKKKLFDLLRMYGVENASKQVNINSSTEWLYNELRKASRTRTEVIKLHKLIALGEKDISDKVFVADCITAGYIDKRSPYDYRLVGGDKIGHNEGEVIQWLNDPRHQSTKARFEIGIEEFYKTK